MKTVFRRMAALGLTLALAAGLWTAPAAAKTNPSGQTVGTVLFYVTNRKGEQILVSQIPVSEMETDLEAGRIDRTLHNYSVLDRYVTTVHQEAQGFLVPDFVTYAQGKSGDPEVRAQSLTFAGADKIAFCEIDQTGFDEMDTYTYNSLYGVARYNFLLLYQYWNYKTQDYADPDGQMTREQVIDHIFANGEPEVFLLSVRAFSQRYMLTEDKYGTGDYNMESLWDSRGLLDNERTIRLLKPMTREELYGAQPTASDTRYWVSRILLEMEKAPDLASKGAVAAPEAVMTEDADNYYIRFSCATPGAAVYYNHNYISPSYMPTALYDGSPVAVPKRWFPSGQVTITAQAVKDGCTDAGVVTLPLTSSGAEERAPWVNPFTDVKAGDWYYDAVAFAAEAGLFNGTSATTFSPDGEMTRAMFATVLWRLEGEPEAAGQNPFADAAAGSWYTDAVLWASARGLVNGYGNGLFGVNDPITREQAAVILYRYAGSKPADTADVGEDAFRAFPDGADASSWAREALAWSAGTGVTEAMPGTDRLGPGENATRAQVAQSLLRFVENVLEDSV